MTIEKATTSVEIDKAKIYKVFISYCWSNPNHENWVHDLAERLMNDGIEVKYDKWDLKEFQELYKILADKMRPMVYELGFLK